MPIEAPPIEDGCLAVEEGAIIAVGRSSDMISQLPRGPESVVHDLGNVILMPGFVNAHAHLELTCYRGRLARGRLWDWLEALIALRLEPGALEAESQSVLAGAAESLAAGVTLVADISRTGASAEVLGGSPIRKVCFVELISGARTGPRDAPSLEAAVEKARRFARQDELLIGVSPHAPYSVSFGDMRAAVRVARAAAAPLTMHLLETAEEREWFAGGGGPAGSFAGRLGVGPPIRRQPVELLSEAGLLSLRPLLAHVNYATEDEIAELARRGASVVWCPRAHRFFGHENHPWRLMLALGIRACLGTDSAASNTSLSILDELRFLWRETPDCPPPTLLAMGTLHGAAALGLDHLVGSLKSGKRADFVGIPLGPGSRRHPLLNLLGGGAGVSGVWINGRRVV